MNEKVVPTVSEIRKHLQDLLAEHGFENEHSARAYLALLSDSEEYGNATQLEIANFLEDQEADEALAIENENE